MTQFRVATLVFTLVLIVTSGTVFFRIVEGWSWLDAYFFTVVTLSTVGYGSLVPATAVGKIGTTIFIILGLGVFAVAIQQFGLFALRKREEHVEELINQSENRKDSTKPNDNRSKKDAAEKP